MLVHILNRPERVIGIVCAVVYLAGVSAIIRYLFDIFNVGQEVVFFIPFMEVVIFFAIVSAVLTLNGFLIKRKSTGNRWRWLIKVYAIFFGFLAFFVIPFEISSLIGIYLIPEVPVEPVFQSMPRLALLLLIISNAFMLVGSPLLYLGRRIGWYLAAAQLIVQTSFLVGFTNIETNQEYQLHNDLSLFTVLPQMTILTLPGVLKYFRLPLDVFARPLGKIG